MNRTGTAPEDASSAGGPPSPAPGPGRIRLIAWRVEPVLVYDDGNLTPVTVRPVDIAETAWQSFKDGGDVDAIAAIEEQYRNQQ